MGNMLIVMTSGDNSLVRLQLEDPGETDDIGAWTQGAWSEASRTAFMSSLEIFADSSPVTVRRIVAHSTDKADEPNAADLWPHILDIDDGLDDTIGNYIEYWVEHTPIDRDAVVTWTIAKGVVEQGSLSNFASTAQAADEQRALHKVSGGEYSDITANIDEDAVVVFVDPDSGTLPKFPNAEHGLGTPDMVYSDGDTIDPADVPGTSNTVFAIDIVASASSRGILLDLGDSTTGAVLFMDNTKVNFNLAYDGSGGGNRTPVGEVDPGRMRNLPTDPVTFTLVFQIIFGTAMAGVYYEGRLVQNNFGAASWPNWLTSFMGSGGKVGAADSTVAGGVSQTRTGLTIQEVRVYNNATIAPEVDVDSRDWVDMNRLNINEWGSVHSTMQAEIDKYKHRAGDIADLKNPGSINKVPNARLAHQLIRGGDDDLTANNGNLNGQGPFNAAIALKSGMSIGNDVASFPNSLRDTIYEAVIQPLSGVSKDQPFVIYRWGGSSLISVDMTSTDFNDTGFVTLNNSTEYWLTEDRIFNVTGLSTQVDKANLVSGSGDELARRFSVGGIRANNWPGVGFALTTAQNSDSDASGMIIGEMCYNNLGANNEAGSCISCGGHQGTGYISDITIRKAYYKNGYDQSDTRTHKMAYWKGTTPYMRVQGGWAGSGPGITFKNDFNYKMVIEDYVSWVQRVGVEIANNGITSASLGYPATNRDEWDGPKANRVVHQNFLVSDSEDYTISLVTLAHSEVRDFIAFAMTNQNIIRLDNGAGADTGVFDGQKGGDSWNWGVYGGTIIANNELAILTPVTDNRTLDDSIGHHNGYLSRLLLVFNTGTGDALVINSSASEDSGDLQTNGRVTGFRVRNSHFDFHADASTLVQDGPDSYTSFATAIASVNGGDTFVDCEEGSVTFAGSVSKSNAVDPLLAYFVAEGYTDYDDVEATIVAAWEAGWDTVPEEIQTQTIIDHWRTASQPTNLTATNYGGRLPGMQASPTLTSSTPATGATITTAQTTLLLDFDQDMGFGTVSGSIAGGGTPTTLDVDDFTINISNRDRITLTWDASGGSGTQTITIAAGSFVSLSTGLPSPEIVVTLSIGGAVSSANRSRIRDGLRLR